jgi:hypothetical protein
MCTGVAFTHHRHAVSAPLRRTKSPWFFEEKAFLRKRFFCLFEEKVNYPEKPNFEYKNM